MTKREIEWAMQHDWYSHCNGDVVYVLERSTDKDGKQHSQLLAFNDLQELRNWAGY
jgi:hypothetical protein